MTEFHSPDVEGDCCVSECPKEVSILGREIAKDAQRQPLMEAVGNGGAPRDFVNEEERFRRLVQNSNDIIGLVSKEGRIISLFGPSQRVHGV